MGHLKDISNQPKLQTFPNSTFEIQGTVPASQCSEAKVEGDRTTAEAISTEINDLGNFVGWNLAGKFVTVTWPPLHAGTYLIVLNTDNFLSTVHFFTPPPPDPVDYYVHNGGSLILTRNVQSFAEFISAAGYAHTIKGGKLYTNIPSAQLQPACRILFAPLT